MLALAPRALCLCALATVTVIACAPVTPGPLGAPRRSGSISTLTPMSRVIDAARIARFGSQSALDAVRMLVPGHRLAELSAPIPPLRSGGLTSRGALRVLVDRHPIFELEALRAIPASEIVAIHILSTSDAMMLLGPGYDGGAIVVWTQAALPGF